MRNMSRKEKDSLESLNSGKSGNPDSLFEEWASTSSFEEWASTPPLLGGLANPPKTHRNRTGEIKIFDSSASTNEKDSNDEDDDFLNEAERDKYYEKICSDLAQILLPLPNLAQTHLAQSLSQMSFDKPDIDVTRNVFEEAMTLHDADAAQRRIGEMLDDFGISRERGIDGLLDHFNIQRNEGFNGLLRKFNLPTLKVSDVEKILNSARPVIPGTPRTIPGTDIPMNWEDRQRCDADIQRVSNSLRNLSRRL
jgi:hypothetical protein